MISQHFRGRPAASNVQPRFTTKTPPSILLKFLYVSGMTMRNRVKKSFGWLFWFKWPPGGINQLYAEANPRPELKLCHLWMDFNV